MKRIFTYIVITFTLMVCHAQENNSVALKIDSLELKINRLQHDYDYLYCEYQLSKINTNLQVLSNELKISTNQITINVYNDNYTDNLYMGYKMSYDSSLELYNSYQLTFRSTCSYISSIVEDLDFKEHTLLYEQKIKVLKSIVDTIKQGFNTVKVNLDFQKSVLDIYKNMK